MTLEREVQDWLVKLIEAGVLLEHIAGIKELDTALEASENEDFIPTFPIDYIVRLKSLRAAHAVLKLLGSSSLASATESISLDKSERLYPDAILFNEDSAVICIVELKRATASAREAITELAAYEQEVRNHFPFLSNLDLHFILLSTDFPVLLDHAASSAIAWSGKRILCLNLDLSTSPWMLRIHVPAPWKALGGPPLPAGALPVVTLCMYDYAGKAPSPEVQGVRVETAMRLLAREGDRTGSHGFALAWHDGPEDDPRWAITVGAINPYANLLDPSVVAFTGTFDTPLSRLARNPELSLNEKHPHSLFEGAEPARRFLGETWTVDWEGFSEWRIERASLSARAFPVLVALWGSIGDYAQEMLLNPGWRKETLHHEIAQSTDWTLPSSGLTILDEITGTGIFPSGTFGAKGALRLGACMGALMSIYNTVKLSGTTDYRLRARAAWLRLEFFAAVRAIIVRYMAANDLADAPPSLVLRGYDYSKEDMATLETYRTWVSEAFFGEQNLVQKQFFLVGYKYHAWLDPFLVQCMSAVERAAIETKITEESKQILLELVIAAAKGSSEKEEILEKIKICYGLGPGIQNIKAMRAAVSKLPRDKHLEHFTEGLMDLVDFITPPAFHDTIDLPPIKADWTWIKAQVAQHRKNGMKFPAVIIGADGSIGIGKAPPEARIMGDVDSPEFEVLVVDNSNTVAPVVTKKSWDDLISGKWQ